MQLKFAINLIVYLNVFNIYELAYRPITLSHLTYFGLTYLTYRPTPILG